MKKAVFNWVRESDEIAEPPATQLHFDGDSKQKTILGGLVSLGVTVYLINMVYTKGLQLVGKGDNRIVSLSEGMNYEEIGKVYIWNETAKPLFEIL